MGLAANKAAEAFAISHVSDVAALYVPMLDVIVRLALTPDRETVDAFCLLLSRQANATKDPNERQAYYAIISALACFAAAARR